MAYYRKLPSGKHNYIVRLPNGRRKSFTDSLKRVAQRQAEDFEGALRRGESVHLRDRKLTLAEWRAQWMRARRVETSTARKEDSSWRNHLEPQWGWWPLDSITRLEVQAWIKSMVDRGVGYAAVHTAYGLLAVMFADAVDHGLITASPCRRVTLPRRGRPEPRWLTRFEYDRLQLALAERTVGSGGRVRVPDPHAPVYRALVGLAVFSGLRPAELAGLDVGGLDFDRRLARVTQVVTRVPDGDGGHRFDVRPYPKSARSVRSVPFPVEVADLLWPIVADRTAGPVFLSPRGSRIDMEGGFSHRVWRPALTAAGIEYVRPYVCRHTCASWLVQAGVSDRRIMQILGHADTHLIDVYAHLAPDQHDEIRAAWGDVPVSGRPTVAPQGSELDALADEQAGRGGGRDW